MERLGLEIVPWLVMICDIDTMRSSSKHNPIFAHLVNCDFWDPEHAYTILDLLTWKALILHLSRNSLTLTLRHFEKDVRYQSDGNFFEIL
ncbi:hypothetical protein Tco_0221219 [Tanacetum coccineum]